MAVVAAVTRANKKVVEVVMTTTAIVAAIEIRRILQCLCNVILLGKSWMIRVSGGHPTDFLSSMVHMHSCQRSSGQ
jgi:hypothetical protein